MEKKILAVIPARGGSKGVLRKNIKDLAGSPLLQYMFTAATGARHLTRIILSTEDDEIAAVGKQIGMEVPFRRPPELATDEATGISVIKHALSYCDSIGCHIDAVISLQATNPFITAATIDRATQLWLETGCDSVTSIAEVSKGHPYITKRLLPGEEIEAFCPIPTGISMKRRQDRETAYFLTGALYLRTRVLIEAEESETDSHYLGQDSRAVVVDETEAIDINTSFDFIFADWMMQRKKEGL